MKVGAVEEFPVSHIDWRVPISKNRRHLHVMRKADGEKRRACFSSSFVKIANKRKISPYER